MTDPRVQLDASFLRGFYGESSGWQGRVGIAPCFG